MTVEQVKASILQLAIQGKLVPQDPNDEPASELLKRIENAKGAKKGKPLPPITDDEKPFSIPDSWEWVRLGEIANVVTGATPSKSNSSLYGGNYKFFKPADLDAGYNVVSASDRLTNAGWEICRQLPNDSVLVTCIGSIGKAGIIRDRGTCNQQINALIPVLAISEFIYFVILSEWFQTTMKESSGKTTLPILNKFTFQQLPFPLPAIAEQKRIVAKIEALFKYVDECEDSRKQLAEILSETLKRSVLQEAIQGRLVPQDPNDEPASELLKRIAAEREKQIAEKKIKKSKPLPPITDDEKPFPIPDSWEWVRLGDVSRVISKGTTPMGGNAAYSSEGAFFVRAENICDNGVVNVQNCKRLKIAVHTKELSRSILKEGDLLISIAGSIGKIGLITSDILPANINQAIAFVRICDRTLLYNRYMVLLLKSKAIQNALLSQKKVTGVPNLTLEIINNLPFPIPPLAEQKRIVAKVDSLLAKIEEVRKAVC